MNSRSSFTCAGVVKNTKKIQIYSYLHFCSYIHPMFDIKHFWNVGVLKLVRLFFHFDTAKAKSWFTSSHFKFSTWTYTFFLLTLISLEERYANNVSSSQLFNLSTVNISFHFIIYSSGRHSHSLSHRSPSCKPSPLSVSFSTTRLVQFMCEQRREPRRSESTFASKYEMVARKMFSCDFI